MNFTTNIEEFIIATIKAVGTHAHPAVTTPPLGFNQHQEAMDDLKANLYQKGPAKGFYKHGFRHGFNQHQDWTPDGLSKSTPGLSAIRQIEDWQEFDKGNVIAYAPYMAAQDAGLGRLLGRPLNSYCAGVAHPVLIAAIEQYKKDWPLSRTENRMPLSEYLRRCGLLEEKAWWRK